MSQLNFGAIWQLWWLLPLMLSMLGIFLSIWVVVPPPTFSLLPFGVCAPEVSPWLVIINAIALVLAIVVPKSWWSNLIVICSLLGLTLSSVPLLQFPATNKRFATEIEKALGTDYLKNIPQALLAQMRSQPLAIADVFRGIPNPEVRINRGIIFASPDQIDLKLNLYRPLPSGKYPALIIIYGGAWRAGNPSDYEKFSIYLANQGYAVIAVDYRHAPQYRFPKQLEDVATALQYIQAHADDLEVNLDRMAIMGRSAGGHLATLTAYQQNALRFRAVVSYYGPVDLTEGYYNPPVPDPIDTTAVLENFLGGTPQELPELYQQASPINHIRHNLPPSLLVYAGRDHLVQAKFGRELYNKLKAADNRVALLEIPWAEHAFDAVFFGVSNQLALYYTERFLAGTLKSSVSLQPTTND
ncbi:MAG TPA: alpha/beta hydrolase [Coleofasciculaceae cyanobacterium]|jgi:acetyl esterase/lipase